MSTFVRLLGFLRPYRRGVFWSLSLAAAAIGGTVAIPWLTGRAIDQVKHGDRHGLVIVGIAVAAAGLLRLTLTVARRLIAGRVSLGVEYDLRNGMYAHLQRLELGFFDSQQTGQLMSRATVDLQGVRFFLGYGLVFLLQSALTLALGATAMLVLNPGLAAIALSPVPFVILVGWQFGKRNRPALQEVQQRIAELTAAAEENVSGVRVVKAFARESHQLKRFRHSVARVFDQSMLSTRIRAFYTPLIGFLPSLGLAAILFFGGRQVIRGTLTIGEFTAFYAYLLMLISPMRQLGIFLGMAQRAVASGARVFQILDRAPAMPVAPDAPPLPEGDGRVEMRGVTMTYPGASEPSLRDVDLDVAAGTTVALVGPTASGKTTLVSLILRLYDVDRGQVLVDGADVTRVDPVSLRHAVALVTDDPFLFSASVHENIAYARPDATREEVEAAARRAQADEFIAELPEGYETLIGERGLTLSGGQRQRLAIARALVADPRILILDDATSSVDATTEAEIKQALREVMRGRTTFIVAHRLSTISLAEDIVVLEEGRILARGDHEELLESSELYRAIVEKGMPDQVFLTEKPREAEVAGL
ncbi:MAG: ABC transporter ATP-binding protein [Actinobacteria bacterium]|nr:MAG: ABC transporter ATP-binding protein [Actinomycetota bacterium]